MRKWIIRLISICFLYGAVMAYLGIITRKNLTNGFLGFSFHFLSGPSSESLTSELDIMALVALCVNLYIVYQLVMRNNRGRIAALVVLWLSIFVSAGGLIFMESKNRFALTESIAQFNFLDHPFYLSFLGWISLCIMFYAIQIYLLMSKSIKMEFQNPSGLEIQDAPK